MAGTVTSVEGGWNVVLRQGAVLLFVCIEALDA